MIFNHYLLVYSLMSAGLNYSEIFELEEAEITYILAVDHAMNEKRRDAQDAQQRAMESVHQQQQQYTKRRR